MWKTLSKVCEGTFYALAIGTLLAACASTPALGPDTKVYYSRPDLGGIFRAQDNELIKYEQTEGYYVLSPGDLQKLLEHCAKKRPATGDVAAGQFLVPP